MCVVVWRMRGRYSGGVVVWRMRGRYSGGVEDDREV